MEKELFSAEGRLKTFKKFPKIKGAPLCNPENFAQAGFYDISTKKMKDLVRCFACRKELDCWEPGDDPWEEHKKRGTECPFVLYRQKEQHTLEDFLTMYLAIRKMEIETELKNVTGTIRSEFKQTIDKIKD